MLPGRKKNTADDGSVKYSVKATADGIKYAVLDGDIFLKNDGTQMTPVEAYNALVGLKITLEDGDVITFIKKLPGRNVYKELFKKLPGYEEGIDVRAVSESINRNIVDVVSASSAEIRNEPQRHQHVGIKDFDQREVFLYDNSEVYRLELCIANLTDGTKIAYVKRYIEKASEEVANKIKKAETAGQTRLNQPSTNSIRNPGKDVKSKMSARDSTGRQLTEAQREYFRGSKVRDKDGNLLVMYHGTPNGGFTQFRSGSYFTQNPEYATVYQYPGASSLSVKPGASNPMNYEVYLNITKPFDTRNPKEREIFMKEYYRKYGTGAPLSESGLPDWTDGMDLQEFIEDMGYDYDGLILDEGATGGYGDEVKSRGLSYVTFSPEQTKRVDNLSPTSDPDMRYSGRDNGGVEGYRKPAYERWDVEAALWDAMDHADRGQDNLIKVGNLPNLIVDKLGIEGDFYIYRNHAYENMVSEETARREGRYSEKAHYHGIGVDTMVEAVMSLEEPILTIATNTKDGNPAVMMVLPVMGKNNAPLYAVLSFYASRDINGAYERKPHVVLTVAERNYTEAGGRVGLLDIIENAIKDGRVISFDKEKRDYLSVNTKATSLGIITEQSLANNIARFRNEIKAYKEKNKITHSARTPTDTKIQHQLEQENESLREDVKYLREMLALQRKVTGGTKFTKTSVLAAARML